MQIRSNDDFFGTGKSAQMIIFFRSHVGFFPARMSCTGSDRKYD